MNDCQTEGAEKCWEITPAVVAGEETVLNNQSFLRALGKFNTNYYHLLTITITISYLLFIVFRMGSH